MNADKSASGGALPTAADLKEGSSAFEVMDMYWLRGFTLRHIASTMKEFESDYPPPPGRKWTIGTVEKVIDEWSHLDPANVPGTSAYRRKRHPQPPIPDLPEPGDPGFDYEEMVRDLRAIRGFDRLPGRRR